MQIKGRKKTDRRGVAGSETHEEEVYTTCVGEEKPVKLCGFLSPALWKESSFSNVITNLTTYITTAAFLYHSVARLCIRMYFHIIITPKPENNLYI